MKPRIIEEISPTELELFKVIESRIIAIPDDFDLGLTAKHAVPLFNCHTLSEAVSRKFGLVREEGMYIPLHHFHSWIRTTAGHIIDVYPCSMLGGPLYVFMPTYGHHINGSYLKKDIGLGTMYDPTQFEDAVQKIIQIL